MFRAVGFLTVPYGLSVRPARWPSTAVPAPGALRAESISRADWVRQRHSWHAPSANYGPSWRPRPCSQCSH